MPFFTSKVTPVHKEQVKKREEYGKMYVMMLHLFFQKFGGRKKPKLESFETYMKERALTEFTYVPRGSKMIYISHEWVGTDHSDPRGGQLSHLTLVLERLQRGDVSRMRCHCGPE